MKAIILARVSTEEQKEAGNSLPAQVARLENYCKQKGFQIVKKHSFDESAYKTKRDDFDKILEYLDSNKEKIAVCFDKVDRFSRNVFDKRVARLYDLAMSNQIELHFVSDNLVITPDISAAEKFHFGINLGLAKYYSDAISDNVKRAYEQKKRNGEWIGKAPLGYLNLPDKDGNKDVVPDPERAHFIQRIFYLYAQGDKSIKTLAGLITKEGLKSRYGKAIAPSMIEHILNNPFYYGFMRSKDKLYQHKYKPLISYEIFKKVEGVRLGWAKKPFKYASKPFVLRGLIKCAKCGCTITPELKKGKYTYYSCTNFKHICKRIWIKEEDLLSPIYDVLKSLQLGDERIKDLTAKLKKLNESKISYHNNALDGLNEPIPRQLAARLPFS
ncbi:MAG: recombinase family protein [Candidatus Jorgensenbacteria bacterium]